MGNQLFVLLFITPTDTDLPDRDSEDKWFTHVLYVGSLYILFGKAILLIRMGVQLMLF